MASRTPKHMPRCVARRTLNLIAAGVANMRSTWLPDRSFGFTLYHKVTDPYHRLSFKKNQMLFLPALLHDLLQQINVAGEGFAPLPRQRVGRERPAFLEGLGHRDVARL